MASSRSGVYLERVTSLLDTLTSLGYTGRVLVPETLVGLLDALDTTAWHPADTGPLPVGVLPNAGLPGYASFAFDPGVTLTATVSRPTPGGFRVDLELPSGQPALTLPGITAGVPNSSGSGKTLKRWVDDLSTPVKGSVHAVVRIEGPSGGVAALSVLPSAEQDEGIVQVILEPPYIVLPGGEFALHLPAGIVIDGSAEAAPMLQPPPPGLTRTSLDSDDPAWRGLVIVGAELFVPGNVPYLGGTVIPVELELGSPTGIDAAAHVVVPAEDGRPTLDALIEWHDPAALSLADCIPTLMRVEAIFELDGTSTPQVPGVGSVTVAAGRPLSIVGTYSRDARPSPVVRGFAAEVSSDGPGGILLVRSDDGNVAAKVFVTAAALATALMGDTPATPPPSGATDSAPVAALLTVAAALSSFCQSGSVTVHGARIATTIGASPSTLGFEVDYSVDVVVTTLDLGVLSIQMDPQVPMRIRHRHVLLELDLAASGLEMFHLSFDHAASEVEDPGKWRVNGPGAPFDVVGNRAGHGSTWFEIDLVFSLDLGPVKIDGATVRATFDGGAPTVAIRGLGARLDIASVITGGGHIALTQDGFEAGLDVSIEPLNLAAAAYLAIEKHPEATLVLLTLDVDLPGAIPLGPTGLGLYGVGGLFGANVKPQPAPPGSDLVEYQLGWTPAQKTFSPGSLMFGLAAAIGTLPDQGFAFSATARILLGTPDLAFRAGIDAGLVSERRKLANPDHPVGGNGGGPKLLGVFVVDSTGVVIGVRGSYDMLPIFSIEVPFDAAFPAGSDAWYVHVGSDEAVGRHPAPISVKILPDLLDLGAWAYVMVHGDGLPNIGGSALSLGGFALAFGVGFHAVYGAGIIWLELEADAQLAIGTAPLLLAGHGGLKGGLHLGPVSIGVSATVDLQIGPGDTRFAHFEVCGEVDLFFFSIGGCVDISIGSIDTSVPEPTDWPTVAMTLADHRYHLLGSAPATAAGAPKPAEGVPVVWPDAIPMLGFSLAPAATGLTSPQFQDALLGPGGQWKVNGGTGRTGAAELSYVYSLTTLRLGSDDGGAGIEVPGPLLAAWQEPRSSTAAASGGIAGELALLTWDTTAWVRRLADGGASRPADPLGPPSRRCAIRSEARPGWTLGASARLTGGSWLTEPEPPPGDQAMSRFAVRLEVDFGEGPLTPASLLGFPGATLRRGHLLRFEVPLDARARTFAGALALPAVLHPAAVRGDADRRVLANLAVVDEVLSPNLLALLVDERHAETLAVGDGGDWERKIDEPSGIPGHQLIVYACTSPVPTTVVTIGYGVGAEVTFLGLEGFTKTAGDGAAASNAANAAAATDAATIAETPKDTRRALLEPGTTYRVEVGLGCVGTRANGGAPRTFGPRTWTFWFATAPLPPLQPQLQDQLLVGAIEAGFGQVGAAKALATTNDTFDPAYLGRYLLGYTPADRTVAWYPDDALEAHFDVDHITALAAKYGRDVSLAYRRTDLPPGGAGGEHRITVLSEVVLLSHSAHGREYLDAATARLFDLAAASPCEVPIAGGTARLPVALQRSAVYDFAVCVPRRGVALGPGLRGVSFATSRYSNPREQLSALGFGPAGGLPGAGPAPLNGGLQASAQLLAHLSAMPSNLAEDSDASFAAALSDAGLSDWAGEDGLARTSVLWVDVAGIWHVAGILLESPEPLQRPHRLRLGQLGSAEAVFGIRRSDSAGTRQLFLTIAPFVPRGRRIPGGRLSARLDLTVQEYMDAEPTQTPAPSSFIVSATLERVPAFARELS
jgi:hypothetical protein